MRFLVTNARLQMEVDHATSRPVGRVYFDLVHTLPDDSADYRHILRTKGREVEFNLTGALCDEGSRPASEAQGEAR